MTPMNGGLRAFATMTAVGYCCAVLAATIVTILTRMLTVATDGFDVLSQFNVLGILLPGLVMTFIAAFPGFLATVSLQRLFRLGRLSFFITAGAADGLLALLLFDLFGRIAVGGSGTVLQPALALCCVAGGAVGGLTYRLVSAWPAAAVEIGP